jgi:archaellum component FlaC
MRIIGIAQHFYENKENIIKAGGIELGDNINPLPLVGYAKEGFYSLMEAYSLYPIIGSFYLKAVFVLFLFFLSIFLYFFTPLPPAPKVQESAIFNKTFKNIILYGSAAATFFGTGLAVKSEILSGKLDILNKELLAKSDLLTKTIDDLSKVQSELKSLGDSKYYANLQINRLNNQYNTLKSSTKSILEEALALRDIIDNPDFTVSEKISKIRDFKNTSIFFERDLGEFKKLSDKLSLESPSLSPAESIPSESIASSSSPYASIASSPNPVTSASSEINKDSIKEVYKANIINWDWFETLSSWEKLAVSLLLSKSIIFSALLGIIFNFYGDFLLNRFNIESRFPKLASVIKLRRTFSKYYFFVDCSLILGVIFLEVIFSLFILKISLF